MNSSKKNMVLVLLALVFVLGACSTPEEKAHKFMTKGRAYYEKSEYSKASIEFRNAITVDPELVEAYYLAGQAELHLGKAQNAYAYFLKAVGKQPDHLNANIELGKLFFAAREFVRAREKAEMVLSKNPGNHQALLLRGAILLGEKKAEEARLLLEKLLPGKEKDVELVMLLATAYRQLGDPVTAGSVLQNGLRHNPGSIPLCLALANFYLEQKQPGKVEEMLRKIMAIEPGQAAHVLRLASFLWQHGRTAEVESLLQGVMAKDKDSETRLAEVAAFYISRGQADKGKELLEAGLRQHQKSFRLRFLLKDALLAKGEIGKAIEVLQECLTLDKDSKDYLLAQRGLAEFYYKVGDVESAEKYLAYVLKKSPNDVGGHLLKGAILSLKGEFDQAVAEYRIAMRERPGDSVIYSGLAEVLVRNRQNLLAIDILKQGLEAIPEAPGLRRALARIYVLEKKPEDAEEQLKKLVADYPENQAVKIDLADFYLANNGKAKAIQIYRQVIAQEPGHPLSYLKLSSQLALDKQWPEALAIVSAGLAVLPDNNLLLGQSVRMHIAAGRFKEALAQTEQRLAHRPGDAFAYVLRGEIHAAGKDWAAAEQDYRKAMELKSDVPDTAIRLARILLFDRQEERVIKETENLIGAPSATMAQFLLLAELYAQTGRRSQALTVYERALKKFPESWVVMNNLAYYLASSEKPEAETMARAEKLAAQARLLAPGNPSALDTLGWIALKQGKMVQARTALSLALAGNPDNPEVNYHFGMYLLQDGKKEEARSFLERAVRSPASFAERGKAEKVLASGI